MATELAPRYDASTVESRWYETWERAGLFSPKEDGRPRYTITIPPPNITGALHMGHALCYPIQDMLGRYKRLRGFDVLILPGTDHASIATQSVVEKLLRKEGTSGSQIGREKFLERAWEWRREAGDTILHQFRMFGCAFDWKRSVFTMDEAYTRAVNTAFIDWFDRGLIYRGKRVINWDPILKTNISDIETERKTIKGKLTYIRYPFADGSGYVTIATTRPETMLGDVAVAVHPSDQRYKGLIGKSLILPLVNREIPLIADIYPDPEFGSGAVKITPAHDANDYAVGQRHNLPMPVLIDESGKITAEGGVYAGLDRIEARKRIVQDLEEGGFLEKIEDHDIPIIISERSGEPIEPLLSEQWFADQPTLGKPVIEAVKEGKIRFVPERYNRIFIEWLENVYDWNISRQLWWGQRVPVYYTEDGTPVAAHSWEEAEQKIGQKIVRQDDDVLDTWFSSGLWPFATMGWPEKTHDLETFYPTSTLVTSREIIYLWVARMAMMGIDFIHEIPFEDVYIYATVLTEDGRRMSKSLGTGVDPGEVIARIGADALRYTLLSQTGFNQDIRYSERRTDDARNFCNKIWNATRFILMNLDEQALSAEPAELESVDKWLLSRLHRTEGAVREAYETYDIQSATQALYRFFWSELCDWYIEVSKKRLSDPATRQAPQWVLVKCIEAFVTMMHPVMPHITEEIYSHLPLPNRAPYLMAAKWPELAASTSDTAAEAQVERWFDITRTLRALRAALDIEPGKAIPEVYVEGDLDGGAGVVSSQAWVTTIHAGRPSGKYVTATVEGLDLHLPIGEAVDIPKLLDKLSNEEEKLTKETLAAKAKLENPMFVERAKPEIVERERANLADMESRLEKIKERRTLLGE